MMYLLILLAGGLTLALEDEQLYCGQRYAHLCSGKGQHVACQFPVAGSGPNCLNYSRVRFTAELRHVITHFMNKRRQRIAAGHERVRGGKHIPKPQVMMFVEWDFELARLAQRLADQCYFVHDACRATVKYPYAGQAVGEVRWRHLGNDYEVSAQRAIRRVFDAWWGERRRVEAHQLVSPFRISDKGLSLTWGHFSQLAIWTLRAVGCGAVRHGEDYPRLLLVCDFSHTNMLGEKTLIPGAKAPCPPNTRRKLRSSFPLLCAPVKEQTIKHSKVVEEDVLDESDYDDEETNSGVPIREELKKLNYGVTGKPSRNRGDDDWGNNKLKPTDEPEVEETTEKRTTAEYNDDHEINTEEYSEYVITTPRAAKPPRKKMKNMKIHLKPIPDRTTTETSYDRKVDEDHLIFLEKNQRVDSRLSGFYDLRERLPSDLREDTGINDDEDIYVQDTLILSQTTSSIPLDSKHRTHNVERLNHKIGQTTISPDILAMIDQSNQHNARHRWKPERERPARPGAAALLRPEQQSPPGLGKQEPPIQPRISFKMDDDDAEQLHADTGFKPAWKNDTPYKEEAHIPSEIYVR